MSTHPLPVAWAMSRSGIRIDLVRPTPAMIDFRDVAVSLARMPRWCGHTLDPIGHPPLSIAQHSIMVSDLAFRRAAVEQPGNVHAAGLWGLLHDAHEYVFADESRPKQRAMAIIADEVGPGRGAIVAEAMLTIRNRMDAAIAARAGLPWPLPPGVTAIVREADDTLLATEARDLMHRGVPCAATPLPDPIGEPLTPLAASSLFLARLRTYAPNAL